MRIPIANVVSGNLRVLNNPLAGMFVHHDSKYAARDQLRLIRIN